MHRPWIIPGRPRIEYLPCIDCVTAASTAVGHPPHMSEYIFLHMVCALKAKWQTNTTTCNKRVTEINFVFANIFVQCFWENLYACTAESQLCNSKISIRLCFTYIMLSFMDMIWLNFKLFHVCQTRNFQKMHQNLITAISYEHARFCKCCCHH